MGHSWKQVYMVVISKVKFFHVIMSTINLSQVTEAGQTFTESCHKILYRSKILCHQTSSLLPGPDNGQNLYNLTPEPEVDQKFKSDIDQNSSIYQNLIQPKILIVVLR